MEGKRDVLFMWEEPRSTRVGNGLKKATKMFLQVAILLYTPISNVGVNQSSTYLLSFGLLSFAFPQKYNSLFTKPHTRIQSDLKKHFASLIGDTLNIILICFYAITSDM